MALIAEALATALIAVDEAIIIDSYTRNGVVPPVIDPLTKASIAQRAQGYAQAIHLWLTTGAVVNTTVNTSLTTLHPPATINVQGTAVAQSNTVPVTGGGTGSGTGVGTIS